MLIAERILILGSGQEEISVPVRIFAPAPHDGPEKESWNCAYEIHWPEGVARRAAGGFDAMQALICALQMIGSDINASAYRKAGLLRWGEPGTGFGFPVPLIARDMLEATTPASSDRAAGPKP